MENEGKHLIRVVYKSGYTHDFWVHEFEIDSYKNFGNDVVVYSEYPEDMKEDSNIE